jgi:ribosomal protein S18 acetylase RimI-like enzyme
MSDVTFRELELADVNAARRLSNQNPDVFGRYAIERLPEFWEIADMAQPATALAAQQRLMLGAFHGDRIVGAAFVMPAALQLNYVADEEIWERVRAKFTDQVVNIYATLYSDMVSSMIKSPSEGLLVHTLCVDSAFRRQGVARRLLLEATKSLSASELAALYVQVARTKGHRRLCESVGFKVLRLRFSFSDRLQFGIWGSILLQFDASTRATRVS